MLKRFIFGTEEDIQISDWAWVIFPYVALTFILATTVWGLLK